MAQYSIGQETHSAWAKGVRLMPLVDEIKQKLPIAPFVAAYTGGLKSTGQNFLTGRCPFHQLDRQPSAKRKFWVNSAKGICGCFVPTCQAQAPGGKPMDVVNFYARLKGISNSQAIAELAKVCGLKE
jgi:DNA primase